MIDESLLERFLREMNLKWVQSDRKYSVTQATPSVRFWRI